MESKYHVGTRSTLRCKLKRKQRPPMVGRYLYALTKPHGDAALKSGLAAAEGRVLYAEALTLNHTSFYFFTTEFISSFQLHTRPISQNITLFRYKMLGCTNSNTSAGAMYVHLHYSDVNFAHLVISNMLYKFNASQLTLVCY